MDAHALAVLELPEVLDRLAAAAASDPGAALALALAPSPDAGEVARRQALTAEAVALLDRAAEPDLGGVREVRDAVEHAERGSLLAPRALHELGRTIASALAARGVLDAQAEDAPLLRELLEPVDPSLRAIADAVEGAIEDDGSEVRDTASPLLRSLRGELRTGRARVAEALRKLARSSELRSHLQEEFVTERRGRPVLAVAATARDRVRGIVHDASASGQTLFVEPFAIVELNNRLSEAEGAEREEVERILRELSGRVGESAGAIAALVEAAAGLDLALARGVLSRGWRGAPVVVSDRVRLEGARHPLLDPATAVPIDLDAGDLRAVVVSGPNTGGKTVALKTLGLAALLHQCGLRPPAVEAELPVFDRILADVGDEQSIAMSLSTFSAHVGNLVAILRAATERSLVLVDELASGTDPVEGSALAQALLAQLAGQARLTVVTTHYPELKEWASSAPGAVNAATALDPETNEPLYRIELGRPGTSHALRTAERLGLDPPVVAHARRLVSPERLRTAELLAEAEAASRAAADARAEAARELAEAERSAGQAREREAELAAEVEAVRASAAQERERAAAEAHRELADARGELEALRREIRAAKRREQERRRAISAPAERAERERDRRLGAAAERATAAERALQAVDRPLPVLSPLAVGDPVEVPELGVRGTLAAITGDDAEVVGRGGLRVRVPVARLRPDPRGRDPQEAPPVRVVSSAPANAATELDVRGRRAEEAREAVRSFVDDAALAGLQEVRVVHGRGTGAVRAAVRDELTRHRLVDRHETESADGATVVHLNG